VVATDFVVLYNAADADTAVVDFDVVVYCCIRVVDNHHAIGFVAKVVDCNYLLGAVGGGRCHVIG